MTIHPDVAFVVYHLLWLILAASLAVAADAERDGNEDQ